MYSDWSVFAAAAAAAVFIWLLVLSFLVWQQETFLKSLFPKSGQRDIRKKFEESLERLKNFDNDLNKIRASVKELEKDGLWHLQRVELYRYNPYDDTGGNISFSLALLDNKGNGIVLTSLHARSGTRVFAKPVVTGKGQQFELSKEEKETVEKAMNKR